MTTQQLSTITPGTDLLHKRYGPVLVERIIPDLSAVELQPQTHAGKLIVQSHTGKPFGTPFLECDPERVDFITAESVRNFHP